MRDWTVAGGILLDGDAVLLVHNRRRAGGSDWSPPGGVIEVAEGESVVDGLTREVEEETGLRVTRWLGPIYEVLAEAPGLGWRLRAEVHVAAAYEGELRVADPDGIVVDARFVPIAECTPHLDACHPWVREPLADWLGERWAHDAATRAYRYHLEGANLATFAVTRL
ncbi:MAG: NUDIX hydrolase [Acidimicrobiales bacterium]